MDALVVLVVMFAAIFIAVKVLQNSSSKSDLQLSNNTTDLKSYLDSEKEWSRFLEQSDRIIKHSEELINAYDEIEQKWNELPDELDPENELAQMSQEFYINRQLDAIFKQIKTQSHECRRWLEQVELSVKLSNFSQLPPKVREQHDSISLIRNHFIDIIIDRWDAEHFDITASIDPELGYDPYDPAYAMDMTWDKVVLKYNYIVMQNNELQGIFQSIPTILNQVIKQTDKLNNKGPEASYIASSILNTINTGIDAACELDLLKPQCYHLRRVIQLNHNHTYESSEKISYLGSVINFAEEHTDTCFTISCNTRTQLIERLMPVINTPLFQDTEEQIAVIRPTLQWEIRIGEVKVICDKAETLTKEFYRHYNQAKDILAMPINDNNDTKRSLRDTINAVMNFSQRISDLHKEGIEIKQSFYDLAKEQNIPISNLPDNVMDAILKINHLAKLSDNLSSKANDLSTQIPEVDEPKKILDIDNYDGSYDFGLSLDDDSSDNKELNECRQIHETIINDYNFLKSQPSSKLTINDHDNRTRIRNLEIAVRDLRNKVEELRSSSTDSNLSHIDNSPLLGNILQTLDEVDEFLNSIYETKPELSINIDDYIDIDNNNR